MGNHQVGLESAINLALAAAELDAAIKAASTLGDGSIICLDGDLSRYSHPFLADLIRKLDAICQGQGITLLGVAKTITGGTDTGLSVTTALHQEGPAGRWAFPLDGSNQHRTIAKLHPGARHAFLIESTTPIDDKTIGRLAGASKDLAFPGYPYGLIFADQLARIPNQERDAMAAVLQAKAAAIDPSILHAMASIDAHSILDRMQY